jgi:hypothetical protein
MGPTALLPFRRKMCWGIFRPKNPTASAGCEPTNLGTKGQHANSRPSKPLYTWDRSVCIFLFSRTTLKVFVKYVTGALYVHPLWFYKHQHDNRVRYKLKCSTQNAFSLLFAAILVNCAPSGEMHNYCTPHIIKENFENFLIHQCNYILLSLVYCVWQVVKTPTTIFNTPVFNLLKPGGYFTYRQV